MQFDPTLTVGALLNAAVLFTGFVIAFTRIGGRIDLLSQRLASVEEAVKQQRDINERLAIIETRQATHGQMIAAVQSDVSELRHGDGFVRGKLNRSIDGEYP